MHRFRRALSAALTPELKLVAPTAWAAPQSSVPSSAEIVLDQMQKRLSWQEERIRSLDEKANFYLTLGVLLAAGFTTYMSKVVPTKIDDYTSWQAAAVAVSIVIFISLITFVLAAHRPREFKNAPSAQRLLEYSDETIATTCFNLADAMRYSIEVNDPIVARKGMWVVVASYLLLVEAVWIAFIVVWQIVR